MVATQSLAWRCHQPAVSAQERLWEAGSAFSGTWRWTFKVYSRIWTGLFEVTHGHKKNPSKAILEGSKVTISGILEDSQGTLWGSQETQQVHRCHCGTVPRLQGRLMAGYWWRRWLKIGGVVSWYWCYSALEWHKLIMFMVDYHHHYQDYDDLIIRREVEPKISQQ